MNRVALVLTYVLTLAAGAVASVHFWLRALDVPGLTASNEPGLAAGKVRSIPALVAGIEANPSSELEFNPGLPAFLSPLVLPSLTASLPPGGPQTQAGGTPAAPSGPGPGQPTGGTPSPSPGPPGGSGEQPAPGPTTQPPAAATGSPGTAPSVSASQERPSKLGKGKRTRPGRHAHGSAVPAVPASPARPPTAKPAVPATRATPAGRTAPKSKPEHPATPKKEKEQHSTAAGTGQPPASTTGSGKGDDASPGKGEDHGKGEGKK